MVAGDPNYDRNSAENDSVPERNNASSFEVVNDAAKIVHRATENVVQHEFEPKLLSDPIYFSDTRYVLEDLRRFAWKSGQGRNCQVEDLTYNKGNSAIVGSEITTAGDGKATGTEYLVAAARYFDIRVPNPKSPSASTMKKVLEKLKLLARHAEGVEAAQQTGTGTANPEAYQLPRTSDATTGDGSNSSPRESTTKKSVRSRQRISAATGAAPVHIPYTFQTDTINAESQMQVDADTEMEFRRRFNIPPEIRIIPAALEDQIFVTELKIPLDGQRSLAQVRVQFPNASTIPFVANDNGEVTWADRSGSGSPFFECRLVPESARKLGIHMSDDDVTLGATSPVALSSDSPLYNSYVVNPSNVQIVDNRHKPKTTTSLPSESALVTDDLNVHSTEEAQSEEDERYSDEESIATNADFDQPSIDDEREARDLLDTSTFTPGDADESEACKERYRLPADCIVVPRSAETEITINNEPRQVSGDNLSTVRRDGSHNDVPFIVVDSSDGPEAFFADEYATHSPRHARRNLPRRHLYLTTSGRAYCDRYLRPEDATLPTPLSVTSTGAPGSLGVSTAPKSAPSGPWAKPRVFKSVAEHAAELESKHPKGTAAGNIFALLNRQRPAYATALAAASTPPVPVPAAATPTVAEAAAHPAETQTPEKPKGDKSKPKEKAA
ncbi:MAG: hypothetical protein AAB544_04685 [Patescibacteria group bacterium]